MSFTPVKHDFSSAKRSCETAGTISMSKDQVFICKSSRKDEKKLVILAEHVFISHTQQCTSKSPVLVTLPPKKVCNGWLLSLVQEL